MLDRLQAVVAGLVNGVLRRVAYYGMYRARVVKQSADNLRVDVDPDAALLPSLSNIPLRLGLPGVQVQIKASAGVYVMVAFDGADPAKPYVHSFDVVPAGAVKVVVQYATAQLLGDGSDGIVINGGYVALGGVTSSGGVLNPLDLVLNAQTIDPYTGAPLQAVGNTHVYAGDV